jgi:hypothetical protein
MVGKAALKPDQFAVERAVESPAKAASGKPRRRKRRAGGVVVALIWRVESERLLILKWAAASWAIGLI